MFVKPLQEGNAGSFFAQRHLIEKKKIQKDKFEFVVILQLSMKAVLKLSLVASVKQHCLRMCSVLSIPYIFIFMIKQTYFESPIKSLDNQDSTALYLE